VDEEGGDTEDRIVMIGRPLLKNLGLRLFVLCFSIFDVILDVRIVGQLGCAGFRCCCCFCCCFF